jgi:tetratricopeptide (TPR) repeat protein
MMEAAMASRIFPSIVFRSPLVGRFCLAGTLALTGGCAGRQAAAPPATDRPSSTHPATRPDAAAIPLNDLKPIPVMPKPVRSATAPARPPVESLVLYAQARDALRDGRRFSAITLLQRAIALDPDSFDLYFTLAQARQGPGAGDEQVIDALNKAVALRPDSLQAQASLGRQYLAKGDMEQAIAHLRLARQTPAYRGNGDEAAAVDLFLGRALQQKGYTQAALDAYDTLLGRLEHPDISMRGNPQLMMLASEPETLYLNVAQLHEQLGQREAALKAYEAAARHDSDDFDTNALVVTALTKMGRSQQAMDRALQLVSQFRGSPPSLKLLNQTYKAAGKSDQVASDLQRLSQSHPDDRGLMLALAQTFQDHGDTARAEAMLLSARQSQPNDPTLLQRLFDLYNASHQVARAAGLLIDYSAAHPRRQDQLASMWQELLRPDRSDRLSLADLDKVDVPNTAQGAKLFWIARIADMGQRSAAARTALHDALALPTPFAPAYQALLGVYWDHDGWTPAQKAQASSKLVDLAKQKGDPALSAELAGLNALRQNQLDQAATAFTQAIKLGDNGADVRLAQATVLHRQGKNADYERSLWSIVGDHADDDDAWQALFQYYIQANQPSRAVSVLGKWLSDNPAAARPRLVQAGVYLRAGRTAQAEALLLGLLKSPTDRSAALSMLGELYAGSGHPEKYVALLQKQRQDRPADLFVLEQLVDVYTDQKRPADAVRALDAARAVVHDPETLYYLSHLYQLAGQKPTSEEVLQQALKLDPTYAPANNDLGYTWAEQGIHLPQAETMVRTALKIDPDNTSFLDSLGWVLYKQGRFEEARESLQKAAVGESPDPVILNHLGDTLYRLSNKAQAAKLWQQSLERIGKLPAPRDELKQLQVELHRKLMQSRQNQPASVAPSIADKATRT